MSVQWWTRPLSASVRRRLRLRRLRRLVSTVHPAQERWRRAALGDHVCQPFTVFPGPVPPLEIPDGDPWAGEQG